MRLFRLAKISPSPAATGWTKCCSSTNRAAVWRRFRACCTSGAASTNPRRYDRKALEALGPIFVKFGQVLSTRRDLLPPDFADELAKLQDRVPPFRFGAGAG